MKPEVFKLISRRISSIEDVRQFMKGCIRDLHLVFHPDIPFSDYVNKDGLFTFSKEEDRELSLVLEKCFDICDQERVDLYEIALRESALL